MMPLKTRAFWYIVTSTGKYCSYCHFEGVHRFHIWDQEVKEEGCDPLTLKVAYDMTPVIL